MAGVEQIGKNSEASPLNQVSSLPGQLSEEVWRAPESPSDNTRDLVLRWLLDAEAEEVRAVLARVQIQRPELLRGLDASPSVDQQGAVSALDHPGIQRRPTLINMDALANRRHLDTLAAKKEPPIVQFTCFMYFFSEGETHASLDVMRIGNLANHSEVCYKTRDNTAKAGVKYVHTEGKLIFQPGDLQQSIDIPLISDESWDTTTEFVVELESEPAPTGCILGRYLWMVRVKVVDSDCFPTNKYRKLIEAHQIQMIPKWGLLKEYISLNWKNRVVKKGTIKMFFCDAFENLYFFSKLNMNVYLVDKILKGDVDKPNIPLLMVVASLLVPFLIDHILDFRRLTWKVGGASRATLQRALVRKFLNYSEESRATLESSDLQMAMNVHVPDLVANGYGKMIVLVKLFGKIFFILLFEVLCPFIFDKPFSSTPFIVLAIFLVLQMSFLYLRKAVTVRVVSKEQETQADLVGQIDRIADNYRMIADYNRRPFFVDRYSDLIGKFNKAAVQKALVLKNNAAFPAWLSLTCVAAYTFLGSKHHLDDPEDLPLGIFLAHIRVMYAIGDSVGSIYGCLQDMQNTFPALTYIVSLLNLPLDIPQRMKINRSRQTQTKQGRATMTGMDLDSAGFPADNAPIVVDNLHYQYPGHEQVAKTVDFPGKLHIQQGEMVALMGPRGQGKATLLRLLGEVILPDPKGFFVPAHLRVVHLPSGPLFFSGTLYENLTFGVVPHDKDKSKDRVLKIVSRLGLPDNVLKWIEGEDMKFAWSQVMSYTQQCLLTLARGLIANPEMLCVERPTMPFDELQSNTVMRMLREFCDEKGVEQDADLRHQRRPRTCVMTKARMNSGCELIDKIYLVNRNGIKHVRRDEVSSSALL
mmetsp:Transcript_55323/g.101379  ORF Transcript_55323/g.101379 Transcript_55323/m.101379 type:complete len:867 (-) Transcript_55323:87-2687(-)